MKTQSPFQKALPEAGTVLLGAILLALAFNLFASNGIPWTRQTRQIDTLATEDIVIDVDTNTVDQPVDTVVIVDTGLSAEEIEQRRIDSIKKENQRIRDSIEKAKQQDSIRKAKEAAAKDSQVEGPGGVKGISTSGAKKILDSKTAVFIDARRSDQFGEGHIPGALNIYAYEFKENIGKVGGIPKNKQIVVYCDGGECELSHDLADDLVKFGFTNVLIYTGGWEEWSKTSYPKATGE